MALREGMNTFMWNEYYCLLAVTAFALIQADYVAGELAWVGTSLKVFHGIAITTLAFIREPRKKNESS